MPDMAEIMRQAQEMQKKIADAQKQIDHVEAEGVAGAGLVKVVLKGKGEMIGLSIDPSLLSDDAEIVEDLVKAAYADARRRLDDEVEAKMKAATSSLGGIMPGFKMPF